MEKEAKMAFNGMQILMVADDPQTVAQVTQYIVSNLDADVAVVDTREKARKPALPVLRHRRARAGHLRYQ